MEQLIRKYADYVVKNLRKKAQRLERMSAYRRLQCRLT